MFLFQLCVWGRICFVLHYIILMFFSHCWWLHLLCFLPVSMPLPQLALGCGFMREIFLSPHPPNCNAIMQRQFKQPSWNNLLGFSPHPFPTSTSRGGRRISQSRGNSLSIKSCQLHLAAQFSPLEKGGKAPGVMTSQAHPKPVFLIFPGQLSAWACKDCSQRSLPSDHCAFILGFCFLFVLVGTQRSD